MSQDYPKQRAKAVTVAAGLLVLADVIGQGLAKKGAALNDTSAARLDMAFEMAEAFVAAAEKRLGGKIDFDD